VRLPLYFLRITLFQIFVEKGVKFVPRNKDYSVVQIHVPSARNDVEFLWLGRQFVGVFAELSGMSVLTRDEKYGTWRNRLYVRERVKIYEFDVAGKRRVRREFAR